jgi:Golgi SNAP receptor complex protein 2
VGIIGSMAGQRERLKATHRKVLDVLNTVGLSDSVLRLVERRHRLDKILVYGGMITTVVLVGMVYYFWTSRSL